MQMPPTSTRILIGTHSPPPPLCLICPNGIDNLLKLMSIKAMLEVGNSCKARFDLVHFWTRFWPGSGFA